MHTLLLPPACRAMSHASREPAPARSAELCIEWPAGEPRRGQRLFAPFRRWMPQVAGRADPGLPLRLTVSDQRGQPLLDLADAGPLTRLPLPPGVYQVRAERGRERRAYTFALGPDSQVHLRLHFEDEAPP